MKRYSKLISLIVIVTIIFPFLPGTTFAASLKIVSIKNLNASIYVNQSYTLPKTIDATMNNKTTQKVSVTWSPKTVILSKTGTFVYKGSVKGYSKQVSLILKVLPLDEEVQRAIAYGLVPKKLQRDYGKSITYAEFCGMLSNLIQKATPGKLSEWNNTAKKALASDEVMRRDDAAVALLYASKAMSKLYTNATDYPDIKRIKANKDSWNFKDTFSL